ncbi:hypothetical protein K466DRAFT_496496 [Polyporus arcularius HHB13444]|uniref:C2H2-type domain-containing protein n=1 Tax=Polyporus arcularius HHB13444 TaxID=1314778 RepID=A0A5C3P5G4_9APHY|nr:hypothetical protein K466DRAFT_496496 [Polyporus arcularius HHB13444]
MAHFCSRCQRTFPTRHGFMRHNSSYHRHPRPHVPRYHYQYHPRLTARPCDPNGVFLDDPHAPPPPRDSHEDFGPFGDRVRFEFANLLFEKTATSKGDIKQLLEILRAYDILNGQEDRPPIYESPDDLQAAIDAYPFGPSEWTTIAVRWNGEVTTTSPAWKRETFFIHTRNALAVMEHIAANPEFLGSWHTRPYRQFSPEGHRVWSDQMSGHWAWKQADLIAQDPATHGAMFVPFNLAADKTTVSVATGNQEFHPLYFMAGNVTNEMRRAHHDAVVPLAFLAIPKSEREYANDSEFRLFKKQLYHESIRLILEPLRPGMTEPHVMRCPDGHYRRSIFGIGPIIADYPEQVYLSGIVQGWCPKCLATPDNFDTAGLPRFRAHTCNLWETYEDDPGTLWDVFGVVNDVTPFTYYFPRADIHELIAPDILHQLVKGTFKDHLVSWVEDYIYLTADSEREAKRILDDIDRRIAAAPEFPGLRRFPHGRNFHQWTGNDSKALMKVFLPALVGYVPDKMVQCISAFLDFSYLARRSSHDILSLEAMQGALDRYMDLRDVFVEAGVRPDGFSLPRQHSLLHWVRMIKYFGSPNGVCTSISESKHIRAVKRPWRASNRNKPLLQILRTNTRYGKLAAARAEFGRRGMLRGDIVSYAYRKVHEPEDADDIEDLLAAREDVSAMARHLRVPALHDLLRRFLRQQLYPDFDEPDAVVNLDDCPDLSPRTKLALHATARATYYAPSELCGRFGMHSEMIRCSPRWFKQNPRYDTVFVRLSDAPGMQGMVVGRVRAFLSFPYRITMYECALVEWFELVGDRPDPVTGLWMVKPEYSGNRRAMEMIALDSVVRACHLMPFFGRTRIPKDFHFSYSLDAFSRFYVSSYADYHVHELLNG